MRFKLSAGPADLSEGAEAGDLTKAERLGLASVVGMQGRARPQHRGVRNP